MKTYHYTHRIGNSRHCVSYHDGAKTHQDGSPRFDLEICCNKRRLAAFLKRLHAQGYVPT